MRLKKWCVCLLTAALCLDSFGGCITACGDEKMVVETPLEGKYGKSTPSEGEKEEEAEPDDNVIDENVCDEDVFDEETGWEDELAETEAERKETPSQAYEEKTNQNHGQKEAQVQSQPQTQLQTQFQSELLSARAGVGNLHGGIFARGAVNGSASVFTNLSSEEQGLVKTTLSSFEEQADRVFDGAARNTLWVSAKTATSLHKDIYSGSLFAAGKTKGIYYIAPAGTYYEDGNTWGQWTPDGKVYSGSIIVPEGALIVFNFPSLVGSGCWLYDNAGAEVVAQTAYSNGWYKNPDRAQYMVRATPDLSGKWLWMKDASYSRNNDADSDWEHAVTGRCYIYINIQVLCEHTYGDWKATVQPDCTRAGRQERSCPKCGDVQSQTVNPLGHSWEKDYYTEANDGTYYKRCLRNCGAASDVKNNPYSLLYRPGEGGTGDEKTQECTYGGAASLKGSKEFVRKYYSYDRWRYLDDKGTVSYVPCGESTRGLTKIYNRSVELEPDWYQTSAQVTFYDWDDRELNTQEVLLGKNALLPDEPERAGYEFVKWDKSTENIQNHLKVKAVYEPKWYEYRFETQGGKEVESRQYRYTETLGTLPETERLGYTFAGWYDAPGEGNLATPQTEVKLGGDTLYARWLANSYYLHFNTGASVCGSAKKRVSYEEKIGILPVASLEDYAFSGWYETEYGENQPEAIMRGDQEPEVSCQVKAEQIYALTEDKQLWAYLKLRYEELEYDRSRRPGPDGLFGTKDDKYFIAGPDGLHGTKDDILTFAGKDGIHGTGDDYFVDEENREIHAGLDRIFGTADDWIDNSCNQENTHIRPGKDGKFGTADDEVWSNGRDRIPGTEDDVLYGAGGNGSGSGSGGSSSGSGGSSSSGSSGSVSGDSFNGPGVKKPEQGENAPVMPTPGTPAPVTPAPGDIIVTPLAPGNGGGSNDGDTDDASARSGLSLSSRRLSAAKKEETASGGLWSFLGTGADGKNKANEGTGTDAAGEKSLKDAADAAVSIVKPEKASLKKPENGGFLRSVFALSLHPAFLGTLLFFLFLISFLILIYKKHREEKEEEQMTGGPGRRHFHR